MDPRRIIISCSLWLLQQPLSRQIFIKLPSNEHSPDYLIILLLGSIETILIHIVLQLPPAKSSLPTLTLNGFFAKILIITLRGIPE
jgi:hypothetical protein